MFNKNVHEHVQHNYARYLFMPWWAEPQRHTVVGLCVCVYLYVCNVFLGDCYKLSTGKCNAGTMRQYLKPNSLGFLI